MFSKKLKKKELIILINNYKEENDILLEAINELKNVKNYKKENENLLDTINELKNIKNKTKEIIIYRKKGELSRQEIRLQNKISYLEKRYKLTNNIIYKNELNRY